jgi:hypothetical protein
MKIKDQAEKTSNKATAKPKSVPMPKKLLKIIADSKNEAPERDQLHLFEVGKPDVARRRKNASNLVLEAFRAPVKFRRIFVDITGGVLPALLLSCIIDHEIGLELGASSGSLESDINKYFAELDISQFKLEWMAETGMSEFEYQGALHRLKTLGILKQKNNGLRLDSKRLWQGVGDASIDHDVGRVGAV